MQKLMKAFHKNQKGFTLVELMVVVVIIGILVAIAIPVYNSVTENAERKSVEANLRTIDGSIAQYQAAYDGSTPTSAQLDGSFLQTWPTGPGTATYAIDSGRAEVTSTDNVGGHTLTDLTLENLPW